MIDVIGRHRRLAQSLLALIGIAATASLAHAQIDYTWQNSGTGDWGATGVNYNWDDPLSVGGDPAPEGRFGEGGIIDNGGTAQVTTVFDNSGTGAFGPGYIEVTGGSTLQITGSGELQIDDSDASSSGLVQIGVDNPSGSNNGALVIESGGSLTTTRLSLFQPNSLLDLDGTASVNVTGEGTASDANLGRQVRITGPNVSFSTSSLQFGDNTVLIPEITSASTHSTIQVTNGVTLGGSVQAEFNGVVPSLGDTWNLVEAATVTGSFNSVSATGVTLGPGQVFRVSQVPNGGTTLVQLGIEAQLYLEVNRDSGAISIKNSDSTGIAFDGYTIGSDAQSLNPSAASWSSLFDQSVAGWVEANPTDSRLNEINILSSSSVDSSSSLFLGYAYQPSPAAFGDAVEDLTFRYVTPTGDDVDAVVVYKGTNVNNMTLIVDPTTGDAQIRNASGFDISIDGYTIGSTSSSLDPNGWQSLADSAVDGWVEANPTSSQLSEIDIDSPTAIDSDSFFNIGDLFSGAVVEDLSFQFILEGESTIRDGIVLYQALPVPGDFDVDGDVDGNDLSDPVDGWNNRFGNDLNGLDFLTWQRNLGTGTGSLAASLSAVPEPSTVGLAFTAAAFLFCRQHRRA